MRNGKRKVNYHTMYQNELARKMIRTVNVKGESIVKGGKCTMEKIRPRPRTITLMLLEGRQGTKARRSGVPPCYQEVLLQGRGYHADDESWLDSSQAVCLEELLILDSIHKVIEVGEPRQVESKKRN